MFNVELSDTAREQFDSIYEEASKAKANREKKNRKKSTSAEGLFKQVFKTLELLQNNPRHPGLQTHEYHGMDHPWDESQKVFEAYVQNRTPGAYRVFWCYGPEAQQVTIIAITPHP